MNNELFGFEQGLHFDGAKVLGHLNLQLSCERHYLRHVEGHCLVHLASSGRFRHGDGAEFVDEA